MHRNKSIDTVFLEMGSWVDKCRYSALKTAHLTSSTNSRIYLNNWVWFTTLYLFMLLSDPIILDRLLNVITDSPTKESKRAGLFILQNGCSVQCAISHCFYHVRHFYTIGHVFTIYLVIANMYQDKDLVSRQKIALVFTMQLPGRHKPPMVRDFTWLYIYAY